MTAEPNLVERVEPLDLVVDAAAEEIRAYARGALCDFTFRVGEIVVRHFHGGDRRAARDVGAHAPSYRSLAVRLQRDIGMSAVALWRCVAIHDVLAEIGDWRSWRHVGPTHVRAVLPLDAAQRHDLLVRAEHEDLSVRDLDAYVRERRAPRARLRRATPPVEELISDLEEALGRVGACTDRHELARMPRSTLERLYLRLFKVRERLEALRRALSPNAVEDRSRQMPRPARRDTATARPARASPSSA